MQGEVVEGQHTEQPDSQRELEEEEEEEEAKIIYCIIVRSINMVKFDLRQVREEAVEEQHIEQPNLQRELEEEVHHCLYPEVAKRPAAVPNELEYDCNCVGQQVEVQRKDR